MENKKEKVYVEKKVMYIWECPTCGVTMEADHPPFELKCWNCYEIFEETKKR